MDECFRCGAPGDKVKLYNAISSKGVVKICGSCASEENFPIIKKPVIDTQIPVRKQTLVGDRLGRITKPSIEMEVNLRGLIDKQFQTKKVKEHPDLLENFHWIIQRIRRARKITREEFAKAVDEPESKIKLIEQGDLSDSDYKIINKIESYLGISLRKPGTSGFPNTDTQKKYVFDDSLMTKEKELDDLDFSIPASKNTKIFDLKRIKEKFKKQDKTDSLNSWEEEYSRDDEDFLNEDF